MRLVVALLSPILIDIGMTTESRGGRGVPPSENQGKLTYVFRLGEKALGYII